MQKIFIVKRATDKFNKIVEILQEKKIEDIKLIIVSNNLEKKSKLRNLFEKEKMFICVPFYPDNEQTLFKIAFDFFKKKLRPPPPRWGPRPWRQGPRRGGGGRKNY